MSGNSTHAAVLVARGDWQQLAPVIGVIPTFVLGVTLGTIMHGIFKRQGQAMVFHYRRDCLGAGCRPRNLRASGPVQMTRGWDCF